MNNPVRVRFAPSPTGPLHIGGVRTALYNFLFARQQGGVFILRVEDTDQQRYVEGAEAYIVESLKWLGIIPDEGPSPGGHYGPYRQSERKSIYQEHVKKLIHKGRAYYAFDTPEELDAMRQREKDRGVFSPKYDRHVRQQMKNSLVLSAREVEEYLEKGEHITVRMYVPENEIIGFDDIIRDHVEFNTDELDDKVILKADGLPTYHLANVVDDKSMAISHVIRGEEWLSSTAHHVLLYRSFGWEDHMPVFAHLPLILRPTGKGKLSKRDGAKFGFPVFPLEWHDKKEDEIFQGFRESGFLPAALLNFLSLLGWNPGTDKELFSLEELCQIFSLHDINKSGAQFNYEKACWFNQQYILQTPDTDLFKMVKPLFTDSVGQEVEEQTIKGLIKLLKPRVELLPDFVKKSSFLFDTDITYDEKTLQKKYKPNNYEHFEAITSQLEALDKWRAESLSTVVKSYIEKNHLKFGDIFPVIRVILTGEPSGPDLFGILELIGRDKTIKRLKEGLIYLSEKTPEDA